MDLNQIFEGEKVPGGALVTSLLMPKHTTNFSLLQPLHTAYNPLRRRKLDASPYD